MTGHRKIEAIPINGFVPRDLVAAVGKPIFEWVDPSLLLVDAEYQRAPSERSLRLTRKIVAEWSWTRFKPPVAVLTEAGLELIDGQHTAIAAATHPGIDKIPVMIVEAPERADRAASFIGHNRDRTAVTSAQIHVAAVAAGDKEALAIECVCAKAGVTVLRTQRAAGRYESAETTSIAAIGTLIRRRGEKRSIDVLTSLARAGLAPVTQLHIKAVELLLCDPEYAGQITAETLVSTIQSMGAKADREAAVFRDTHPTTPLWKSLAIAWFKGRKVAKGGQTSSAPEGVSEDLRTRSGKLIENITSRAPSPIAIKQQAAPVGDNGKRDARSKLNGWVPGVFLLRCSGCDEKYQGDRKSRLCADCAYECREAISA